MHRGLLARKGWFSVDPSQVRLPLAFRNWCRRQFNAFIPPSSGTQSADVCSSKSTNPSPISSANSAVRFSAVSASSIPAIRTVAGSRSTSTEISSATSRFQANRSSHCRPQSGGSLSQAASHPDDPHRDLTSFTTATPFQPSADESAKHSLPACPRRELSSHGRIPGLPPTVAFRFIGQPKAGQPPHVPVHQCHDSLDSLDRRTLVPQELIIPLGRASAQGQRSQDSLPSPDPFPGLGFRRPLSRSFKGPCALLDDLYLVQSQ